VLRVDAQNMELTLEPPREVAVGHDELEVAPERTRLVAARVERSQVAIDVLGPGDVVLIPPEESCLRCGR
jgi:hypothetical protein